MTPEIFNAHTSPFLACLLGVSELEASYVPLTWQTFDDRKMNGKGRGELARTLHGSLDDVWNDLKALNQQGAGIFVTVNGTDGKGRKKSNIQDLRAWWCDVDNKGARAPFDLADLPLPPSMVVLTAGGWHLYWIAQHPIPCKEEARRTEHEAEVKAIAQFLEPFGGDLKACDVARVLRVPGFLHQKGEPALVTLEKTNGSRVERAQVLEAFPFKKPEEKRAMKAEPEWIAPPQRAGVLKRAGRYLETLPPGISGQGGHAATFDAALKIISGFDLSADEAVSILADHFNPRCVPPWTLPELVHKVQSAGPVAVNRGHLLQDSHNRKGSCLARSGVALSSSVLAAPAPAPPGPAPEPRTIVPEVGAPPLRAGLDPRETSVVEVPGFEWKPRGLFRVSTKPGKDGEQAVTERVWIAPTFTMPGLVRDETSHGWRVLIAWTDLDGLPHEEAVPFELLNGEGMDLARALGQGGLMLPPDTAPRKALLRYLCLAVPRITGRVRMVDALGWQDGAFVLPGGEIIGQAREPVRFAGEVSGISFRSTHGTLEGWKDGVARFAVGNPRLSFALACAFSGPLLSVVRPDGGGGFNLMGSSSKGKTTCLEAAASVWGRPDPLPTWRATGNGLEGIAATRNDGFLVLDELSQVDPKEAGSIAYMLSNGSAKARATKEGGMRAMKQWRLIFLSSGEQSLEDKLSEDGKRVRGGQEVRVPDVPCPPDGMFQDHHELASMGHLAEHLKAHARMHYGHAARAFLRGISDEWPRHDAMVRRLREMEAAWIASAVPPSADGQVRRVAARFALVAVAGELAQRMGVLPWPEGEASQGASICFKAWLDRRGHIGASERERGLQGVVDFLALHGLSRFAEWNNPDAKPVNMAGVRKASESAGVKMEDGWDFFLTPTGWKEACRGFESRGVARDAIEEGLLEASQDGAPYQKRKTPHGQGRFYVIRARGLGTFRAGALT